MKQWFSDIQLALITVYVIVAVDVFGLTLIVPVIVTYARYLGATEAAVGYLYAVYSGMALLSAFFVGRLSDKYGRRAVFLYCCVGAIASFVGSALSTTFIQFAVCRGISGLFTGTMGNAYAYIGDIVPEKDKAKYISYVTATMSICFVVGPIVGGGFAAIDIRAPFIAAAGMAILELVLILFFVHDPKSVSAVSVGDELDTPILGEEHQLQQQDVLEEDLKLSNANTSLAFRRTDTMDSTDVAAGPVLVALPAVDDDATAAQEARNPLLNPASSEKPRTSDSSSEDEATQLSGEQSPAPLDISPWLNPSALLIGGVGIFLSTSTYCGMAILIPFLLMDPSFGIVHESNDDNDDLSSGDSKRLALMIGFLLTILGSIQVVGMLAVFPKVNKRLGLMFTGSLGACIYGGSFCFLALVRRITYLYPIVVGLAVGYSLCRPVYPAFLSAVAHPDRRADYQTMSMAFVQVAWIFAVLLTQFWALTHTGAILYCGGMSLLNSAMMLVYGIYTSPKKGKTLSQ